MCFSSTASFTAAAVLTTIGVVTIKKVKDPRHLLFASIPFVFGIQQLSEGFVWLSLMHSTYETYKATFVFAFLLIAQVIWPLFVPISMYIMEEQQKRKNILFILSLCGIAVSIYRLFWLIDVPTTADIIEQHITYKFESKSVFTKYYSGVYFFTTVISTFISSGKKMKPLGLAILISVIISRIFFYHYFISVWCFFAALISIFVYIVIRDIEKSVIIKAPVKEIL